MCTGDAGLGVASMQRGKKVHELRVRGGVQEHDVWSNKRKAKIWCDLDEGRDENECRDENAQGSARLQRRVRSVLAAALS
jgi:hypothetical protein